VIFAWVDGILRVVWGSHCLQSATATLLAVQHPFAWIVCLGYWTAVVGEVAVGNTRFLDVWRIFPGVSCQVHFSDDMEDVGSNWTHTIHTHDNWMLPADMRSDTMTLCRRLFHLDMFLHLLNPFLMMRQLEVSRVRMSNKAIKCAFGTLIVYGLWYVGVSVVYNVSPYMELDLLRYPFETSIKMGVVFVVFSVRVVMDRYSIFIAL
jgi:hypothetical protein